MLLSPISLSTSAFGTRAATLSITITSNNPVSHNLSKLGVTFVDKCCPDAGQDGIYPVRWNANVQQIEYFDGTDWNNITQISETTTTTTAATTTTTAAPTTTTTTAEVTTTTTGV